jgi:hypothetical protein
MKAVEKKSTLLLLSSCLLLSIHFHPHCCRLALKKSWVMWETFVSLHIPSLFIHLSCRFYTSPYLYAAPPPLFSSLFWN